MKIKKTRYEELVKAEGVLDMLYNAYCTLGSYDLDAFIRGVFGEKPKSEGNHAE